MSLFMLAIKNLMRNVLRSAALFLALFVLSGTLVSISLLAAALTQSIELSRQRLGADVMVVPSGFSGTAEDLFLVGSAGSFTMKDAGEFQRAVLASEGVKAASPQLFVVSAPLPCCSVSDTMIVGYDPETDFVITPWLQGRRAGGEKQAPDDVVVGADILAGVGGRLKFYGHEFLIVGKLERTGMRYLDSGMFIPLEGVRTMIAESKGRAQKALSIGPDEISCLLVKLREDANAEKFALRLEHRHPDKKALLTDEMVRKTAGSLAIPLKGMALMFILQWAASLFLIGVVHKFSVDERRFELGIMKALGATDANIRSLLTLEIVILSGAACFAGIASGLLLIRTFSSYLSLTVKVPLVLPQGTALAGLVSAAFAVSLCSALAPALFSALRSSKIEPFYLIRGEVRRKEQG